MRTLAIVAGAWLLLAGIALAVLWPSIPASASGWALLVVFGPPALVVGELVGEIAMNALSSLDARFARRPRWQRIVAAVLVGALVLLALMWLYAAAGAL